MSNERTSDGVSSTWRVVVGFIVGLPCGFIGGGELHYRLVMYLESIMSNDSAWDIGLTIQGVVYLIVVVIGVLLFRARWTFLASCIFGCLLGALSMQLLLMVIEMGQQGHGTIG
jgi:hypothetical protein